MPGTETVAARQHSRENVREARACRPAREETAVQDSPGVMRSWAALLDHPRRSSGRRSRGSIGRDHRWFHGLRSGLGCCRCAPPPDGGPRL